MQKSLSQLSILIPTLNESESIALLIERLCELYPLAEIVVIDDGSKDPTQSIVRQLSKNYPTVSLIDRSLATQHGITASVLDGIRNCSTEFFIVMDGDYQHPPATVADIFAELEQADIVIASRRPYVERQALHRRLFTISATLLAQILLRIRGIKIQDPMSGFFGSKTALIQQLVVDCQDKFEPCGYKILFDILRSVDPSLKISEVKYDFGIRPGGHSKLRAVHGLYFFRSLFR